MTRTISNSDDVVDSRDVIARIEELQEDRDNWSAADDYTTEDEIAEGKEPWEDHNPDEADELKALESLQSEAEGYSEDWRHGATLIRGTYLVEYFQEMLEDCGDLPKDLPSYLVIDWDATAENLKADYTAVDWDGVEYWVR